MSRRKEPPREEPKAPETAVSPEAVAIGGIVRSRDEVRDASFGGWCELDAGESPERREWMKSFVLETTDGHRVTVETLDREIEKRLVPERTVRGEWSEVESNPLARLVESVAPGPTVRVRLRGAVLRDGDPVFVIGRVVESSFDEQHGGMRSGATSRPSVIRPEVIGVGEGAESAARRVHDKLHPKPRPVSDDNGVPDLKKTLSLGFAAAWVVVAVLLGAWLLLEFGRSQYAPIVAGAVLTALATAMMWRPRHLDAPRFIRMKQSEIVLRATTLRGISLGLWVVGGIVVLSSESLLGSRRISGQQEGLVLLGTMFPIVIFALAVVSWLAGRSDARSIRALLAPARDPKTAKNAVWTTVAGTVMDRSPVEAVDGQPVAMFREVRGEKLVQKTDGALYVTRDGDREIEVEPSGATWTSAVTTRAPLRKKDGEIERIVEQEIVPIGGSVIVAGRLEPNSNRMHATGPDSLILFAAQPGSDARDVLRRVHRTRLETLFMVSMIGASAAALDVAVVMRRPVPVLNPAPLPAVVQYSRDSVSPNSFEDVCSLPQHEGMLRNIDDSTISLYTVVAPFPIRLYGRMYMPPFSVSSNGWMSLLQTTDSGLSGHIPDRSRPNAVLAPYWTDLKTRWLGVCAAVTGEAPHRRFVVQWQDAYDCCSENSSMHLTFEIVIHEAGNESNVIDFLYRQMDGSHRTATVGIEDGDGLEGTSTSGTFSGPRGIRWTPY